MLKVIQGARKVSLVFICALFVSFGLIMSGDVNADTTVDYNVTVAPSLNLTFTGDNPINLNLNPNTKTSDSKTVSLSVSTNNITGYNLTMSTTGNDTNLNRNATLDSVNATIPTLSSGSYATPSAFPDNTWGYKQDSGDFIPYVSGREIKNTSTAIDNDTTTLAFGAKINYDQPSGVYSTTLNFTATVNPLPDYMQTFTIEQCIDLASSSDYTLIDRRDNKEYTVRYLNGNCWMTQNLRFGQDTDNPNTTTLTLTPSNSNVSTNRTIEAYDLVTYGTSGKNCYGTINSSATGDGYLTPCMHSSSNNNYGVWYNYAAATAGTITEPGNTTDTTEATESICPKGWKLPSQTQNAALISALGSGISAFHPVYGGKYGNGSLENGTTHGFWWSTTANDGKARYGGYYNSGSLSTYNGVYRRTGVYIRCVMDLPTMQSFTNADAAAMSTNQTKHLQDSRDGQEYTITKLADGNVWMTKNLMLGRNVSNPNNTTINLTPDDSNVSVNRSITVYDSVTYGTSGKYCYDANGANSPGHTNPCMHSSSNNNYGAWYNYATATAGTITAPGNSSTVPTPTESICPKGWGIPTYTQAQAIIAAIGSSPTPFNPVYGGAYSNTNLNNASTYGYWSTNTPSNGKDIYRMHYNSGALNSNNTGGRASAYYIRCIFTN